MTVYLHPLADATATPQGLRAAPLFSVGSAVCFIYRWRFKRGVVKEIRATESVIIETWKRGTRGYIIDNELIELL